MSELYCKCNKPKLVKVTISNNTYEVCSKNKGGCGCEFSNEVGNFVTNNKGSVTKREGWVKYYDADIIDSLRYEAKNPQTLKLTGDPEFVINIPDGLSVNQAAIDKCIGELTRDIERSVGVPRSSYKGVF